MRKWASNSEELNKLLMKEEGLEGSFEAVATTIEPNIVKENS